MDWTDIYNEYLQSYAKMKEIYDDYLNNVAEANRLFQEAALTVRGLEKLYQDFARINENMSTLYKKYLDYVQEFSYKWARVVWGPPSAGLPDQKGLVQNQYRI
jgi:hypothetical protein